MKLHFSPLEEGTVQRINPLPVLLMVVHVNGPASPTHGTAFTCVGRGGHESAAAGDCGPDVRCTHPPVVLPTEAALSGSKSTVTPLLRG